jgi:hypothetical protein
MDLHHFGNLDPDPHPHQGDKPDTDTHQLKIRIRIRIKMIRRIRIRIRIRIKVISNTVLNTILPLHVRIHNTGSANHKSVPSFLASVVDPH